MDRYMVIALVLIAWAQCSFTDDKRYAPAEPLLNNEAEQSTYEDKLRTFINVLKNEDEHKLIRDDDTDGSRVHAQFDCDSSTSPEVPNSVHQLRPGDIQVMGAMGDSLTAAFGAKARTVPGVAIQYRGVASMIGGDENLDTVETLPNIFRKYNQDIYGFSTGTGSSSAENSRLNVAVGGAKAHDMPEQAETLVRKMKEDPNVDLENDWKFVSIFIGGNDLCAWCKDTEEYDPTQYVANIEEAITILQQLPRTFVNVIGILKVYLVSELTGVVCDIAHNVVCSCGMGDEEETAEMRAVNKEYQVLLEESITSGQFDTRDDFTAVYQPYFTDTDLPRLPDGTPDYSYWAPDCFHLSEKGQSVQSVATWNSLIQPVGEKDRSWDFGELKCPSAGSPYLFTNVNSITQGVSSLDAMAADNGNSQQTTVPTSTIVVGVVGCAILMLAVVALSVTIKRRRKSTRDEKLSLVDNQFS